MTIPFGMANFQGQAASFKEGINQRITNSGVSQTQSL